MNFHTNKKYLLSALIAAHIGLSNVAQVQAETANFNIAKQPLSVALDIFADQAGVQILFTEGDVKLLEGRAVSGKLSLEEALKQLLEGTGLVFKYTSENTLVVHKRETAPADEQSGVDSSLKFALEEVVVTATRREENLQGIPMSVNAFSGERLEESGVENIQDIQSLAGGLQVANVNGLMQVTIRGIGSGQLGPGAESGAAVHRDGVYLAQRQDLGMGFFDVERIEVLRGPQGTLYGRNATGGSVNIISKSPTPEFEAGGSTTLGNYDLVETEGYASGPLVNDKLMARVAFKTRVNDGYTPNIFNGEGLDNDDSAALRSQLRYEPTADIRLDFIADYARDDGVPRAVHSRFLPDVPLTGETMGSVLPSGRAVNNNDSNINEKEAWGLNAHAEWNMDSVTLTSRTAYREFQWLESFDSDATDVSLTFIDQEQRDSKQISEELILSSSGNNNLQWVAGIFYFHLNESQYLDFVLPTIPLTVPVDVDLTSDAYAAFAEASYPILDRLTLTLGARYSYEKKSLDQLGGDDSEQLEDSWNDFTPKAALTYALSDNITAYATIGRGFKAGTFNGGTIQGKGVTPEKVTNYEAGLKTSLYDHRLRFNISAFHMDYSDLQVLSFGQNSAGIFVNLLNNAATAVIRGVEVEFQAQPTESLSLDGNISYLDATFEEWPNAVDLTRGGDSFDVSDNRMPNAPERAVNLGVDYSVLLGNWGTASLRGEYAYKSRVFFTPFEDPIQAQDGFGLFNARLTFEHGDGKWRIAAWVKNITDELVASQRLAAVSAIFGPRLSSAYLPPRTYGVTVGYSF